MQFSGSPQPCLYFEQFITAGKRHGCIRAPDFREIIAPDISNQNIEPAEKLVPPRPGNSRDLKDLKATLGKPGTRGWHGFNTPR